MVIGTILMFAIGVALLGLLQVTLIPSSNADVEAQHSQQVRGEMQDLRNDIQRSAASGGDYSQGVQLGTEYPSRAFFLNPGPAAGSINTAGTEDGGVNLNITNARALNAETDDFWNGTTKSYGTGAVVYRPGYNVYSGAPDATVVENSLVYSEFDGTTLLAADQRVVDGQKISLVAIDGRLSQSQVNQYAVDINSVSGPTQTILVENTSSSEPVTVNITTRLSEETLIQDVFASEIDDPDAGGDGVDTGDTTCASIVSTTADNDRYVADCRFSSSAPGEFNNFTLIMEADTTYELELAKVGVGNGADPTSAAYMTAVEGNSTSVVQGATGELVVQVRDPYNNPIPDKKVNFSINQGSGTLFKTGAVGDSISATTNEHGRATVAYKAPPTVPGPATPIEVDASYKINTTDVGGFDATTPENVTFEFDAINSSQTQSFKPLLNPVDTLQLNTAKANNTDDCKANKACQLNINFTNNAGEPLEIQQYRYVFYSDDTQGAAGGSNSGALVQSGDNGVDGSDPIAIRGDEEVDTDSVINVPSGGTANLTFVVYDSASAFPSDDSEIDIVEGEFFVITLNISGERETYFVAPTSESSP